jgi:gamma-glutamylcysteine synthetase
MRVDGSTAQKRDNETLVQYLSMTDEIASLGIDDLVENKKKQITGILDKAETALFSLRTAATLLDGNDAGNGYAAVLNKYISQIRNPEDLVSSRIVSDMKKSRLSWDAFGQDTALKYAHNYRCKSRINSNRKAV